MCISPFVLILDLVQQRFISPFFFDKKFRQPFTFFCLCNQPLLELSIDMNKFNQFPFKDGCLFISSSFCFQGYNLSFSLWLQRFNFTPALIPYGLEFLGCPMQRFGSFKLCGIQFILRLCYLGLGLPNSFIDFGLNLTQYLDGFCSGFLLDPFNILDSILSQLLTGMGQNTINLFNILVALYNNKRIHKYMKFIPNIRLGK